MRPADDASIEGYMRENLKLTPAQRLNKFVKFARFTSKLRRAGEKARQRAVETNY